ncbi:MAG: CPBP family intramembrane glutamic endopeptidase, partial [Actinomycetota bacterium]
RGFGKRKSFSLSPLGVRRPANGFRSGAVLGLAVGVGALAASFPLNALSAYVLETLGYRADRGAQQPLMRGVEALVSQDPVFAVPAVFLVVVVVGPAVEELVFRGAIFGGLYNLGRLATGRAGGEKRFTKMAAFVLSAALSSALFASLHLEPAIFPAIFVLAASLCWLLRRTGSLLPPFIAHATFNSFATTLLVLGGLGVLPSQA